PDRDPQLFIGPTERALDRAEDLGPDRARGVQPPDDLELDPRGALPVQVVGHRQERDRLRSCTDRADRGPDRERLALGVEMRTVVGVDPMAMSLAEGGLLAGIARATAGERLVMDELGLGAVDATVAGIAQAVAVIHVVVGDGEPRLVEAPEP